MGRQRAELGDFLRTRRDRMRPEDAGLPGYSGRRRVPGLRREELAVLAKVSVAYYTRLEQGEAGNVSVDVLESLARALRLTDSEREHLLRLAGPTRARPTAIPPSSRRIVPSLQRLLDGVNDIPAYVCGRGAEILAWNPMAAALFGDWARLPRSDRNWARMIFLHPGYRDLFVEWEQKQRDAVAALRLEAGRHPDDKPMSDLIGELLVKNDVFRRLWATHDVKEKRNGIQLLRHPLVGDLVLNYDAFRAAENEEQSLVTYYAEPGAPSADALSLLASLHAEALPSTARPMPKT
ncbi:helix-turn-helix transcriptional regulator [Umezawaea sp. NPDC059074]|uniref:helix-turn-helix transcriptional regulator n=1 Tax=Umezawaea sp. NPDC059074 TaxID=3346716 RepID=UPI0036842367